MVVISHIHTPLFSAVRTDNKPRTENEHIRNVTRDVLRRLPGTWIGRICRRNCARVIAHVRA